MCVCVCGGGGGGGGGNSPYGSYLCYSLMNNLHHGMAEVCDLSGALKILTDLFFGYHLSF